MDTNIWARVRRPVSALIAAALVVSGIVLFRGDISAASSSDASQFQNNASVKKQQQTISDLEKKQANLKKEIASLQNDIDGLMAQKSAYDELIEICETKLAETEKLIEEYKLQEKELQEDIANKKAESAELYERIKSRMVVSYESGGSRATYLELIFGAESIYDFMVGLDRAVSIMEYDTKLMEDYKDLTESLEEEHANLEASIAEREEAASSLQAQRDETETLLSECEALMVQAQKLMSEQQTAAQKVSASKKAAEAELDAIIDELIKKNGATQSVASGEYMWPLQTKYTNITSYFGARKDPFTGLPSNHGGTDIYAPKGSKIYASNSGTVVKATYSSSYGNYVMIDHGGNVFTLYAHCSKLLVSAGTYVEKGTVIAEVGMTGSATGYHLHFEVIEGKTKVDALKYVTVPK